jgi:hypothetical protein
MSFVALELIKITSLSASLARTVYVFFYTL